MKLLTKTSQQDDVLSQSQISFKAKITLQRNEISDIDVGNHLDITGYVTDLSLNYDFDRRNAMLDMTLDNSSLLLSPKNKVSPYNIYNGVWNPLIYPNHKIRVWIYLVDPSLNDAFAVGTNNPAWQVFTGITGDDISLDTNNFEITLSLRDKSKELQDTYIELSKSYDSMIVEDVLIDLLKVHLGNRYIFSTDRNDTRENVLIIPQPTNYLIEHYQVKDSNLWDAVQKLADLMGWVLRFNGKGQLLFYQEVEEPTQSVYTINPDVIIENSQSLSDADIRNDIIVNSQNQNYDMIQARFRNEDSINTYGWRPMIISQDLTSYINTYSQAFQLARAVCRDMSWMHSKDTCGMPLAPFLEVGDIVNLYNPRSDTGTTNVELFKISSYKLKFNDKQKRTNVDIQEVKIMSFSGVTVPAIPTGLNAPESEFEAKEEYVFDTETRQWNSIKQTVWYPKLKWNEVTTNTNGTVINDLSGYTIYRKISTDTDYVAITSVRAYFQGLRSMPVTYFIDYTLQPNTVQDVSYNYMITAHNVQGQESNYSTYITVTVPKVVLKTS